MSEPTENSTATEKTWPEIQQLAESLLTGVTTSAVTQTWGCGHSVYSTNGDALYAACPVCHAEKVVGNG